MNVLPTVHFIGEQLDNQKKKSNSALVASTGASLNLDYLLLVLVVIQDELFAD